MKLTVLDLQSQEKLETLRARGRNFFRCLIDPVSTDTLENIIRRREAAGEDISALQESLEIYRNLQKELTSFPAEEQGKLLALLDAVSEEVYLSACGYQLYDFDYLQSILGR